MEQIESNVSSQEELDSTVESFIEGKGDWQVSVRSGEFVLEDYNFENFVIISSRESSSIEIKNCTFECVMFYGFGNIEIENCTFESYYSEKEFSPLDISDCDSGRIDGIDINDNSESGVVENFALCIDDIKEFVATDVSINGYFDYCIVLERVSIQFEDSIVDGVENVFALEDCDMELNNFTVNNISEDILVFKSSEGKEGCSIEVNNSPSIVLNSL